MSTYYYTDPDWKKQQTNYREHFIDCGHTLYYSGLPLDGPSRQRSGVCSHNCPHARPSDLSTDREDMCKLSSEIDGVVPIAHIPDNSESLFSTAGGYYLKTQGVAYMSFAPRMPAPTAVPFCYNNYVQGPNLNNTNNNTNVVQGAPRDECEVRRSQRVPPPLSLTHSTSTTSTNVDMVASNFYVYYESQRKPVPTPIQQEYVDLSPSISEIFGEHSARSSLISPQTPSYPFAISGGSRRVSRASIGSDGLACIARVFPPRGGQSTFESMNGRGGSY